MALATKTVRYGWGSQTTATADLTDRSLGTKTVYLPETTSRTIRSAFVVATGQDIITATGGSVNRIQLSVVLGAAAASVVNDVAATITNTGENIALHWHADFTAYFQANFGAGASQTCEIRWLQSQNTGTTAGYQNVCAELFLTYEYDDAAGTHVKTVVIPLESGVGALATASLTSIGTNQIPQLTGAGGILPEASPVIRDYYFVIEGNEANAAGTTDWTLGVALDAEAEAAFGITESALASDRFVRFMWNRSASVPTTTAVHDFKARSNAQARLNHMSIQLIVTYEFTPPAAGANRTINSILVPFVIAPPMGGTAAADNQRVRLKVQIQEPGTITMRQSGVQMFFTAAAQIAGLNVRVGAQAYRAYTHNVATSCGGSVLQARIDSGAAGGAALTLARGINNIDIDVYRTDTADFGSGISGFLILNYESDTSTGGVSRHARSTWWHLSRPITTAAALTTTAAAAPVIAETQHSQIGIGWLSYILESGATNKYQLTAEIFAGEHFGDGWYGLDSGEVVQDAELGVNPTVFSAEGAFFERWWADTETERAVLETARRYRMYALVSTRWASLLMCVTYHSMYFQIAGNVTDSAGGTVEIEAYRVSDGEFIGSTSRVGNGAFTIDVPTDDLAFIEARESGSLLGRSDNDTPTRIA